MLLEMTVGCLAARVREIMPPIENPNISGDWVRLRFCMRIDTISDMCSIDRCGPVLSVGVVVVVFVVSMLPREERATPGLSKMTTSLVWARDCRKGMGQSY